MKPLLIRNVRFLDPGQNLDRNGSMILHDGRIAWFGGNGESVPQGVYDLIEGQNLVVCPGFIDLHCHLRQPGYEEKETIATGTQAALRGGFSTICCMPNTKPPLDNVQLLDFVKTKSDKEGAVHVLPVACVSKDRAGKELTDMIALAKAGAVAFSDDGEPVRDNEVMRQALQMTRKLNVPVMDHCEAAVGGDADSEIKMVARDLKLAEETGGWIHVQHVSTAGSVKLIKEAKTRGVHVSAEATPHHLTLNNETIKKSGTLAKVNPPLRTEADRLAVIQGLKEGTIDCIATDHAPHTAADKQKEYQQAASGISGFETAFGSLMSLVHAGQLTLEELIYRMTAAPAKILGKQIDGQGKLEAGKLVDITIIHPTKEWKVNINKFASKGKNTPLNGMNFMGKVVATLPQGKTPFIDESVEIIRNYSLIGKR